MFAIPGLSCLIIFLYLRPQEYYTFLQKAPLLYIFFAAAVGGLVIDYKLRLLKPMPSRVFWLAVGFFAWVVIVDAIKAPAVFVRVMVNFVIVFGTFLVIGHAVQSFRALRIIAGTVLGIGMVLAIVGVHQGSADHGCLMIQNAHLGHGTPDGRKCETVVECLGVDAEPGVTYDCQRVGLMGTTALDDRVRYRGDLQDPNELALVVVASMPFLIAFAIRKRHWLFKVLAAVGIGLVFKCVINTQSRGGMLIFLAAAGVYFIKKYGAKYAVIGVFVALPLMAMGGRSGSKADASTHGRYMAWRAGLEMLQMSPIFGVGHRQFTQHHDLTAHNTYVLTAAELGFIGMFLWVGMLYVTIKVPVMALRDFANDARAPPARVWSLALIAMSTAYVVQYMFLSLAYHTMTWVLFGLSAALYSAIKSHAPNWEVKLGLKDAVIVVGFCLGFLAVLPFFLTYKGF